MSEQKEDTKLQSKADKNKNLKKKWKYENMFKDNKEKRCVNQTQKRVGEKERLHRLTVY